MNALKPPNFETGQDTIDRNPIQLAALEYGKIRSETQSLL